MPLLPTEAADTAPRHMTCLGCVHPLLSTVLNTTDRKAWVPSLTRSMVTQLCSEAIAREPEA